MSGAVTIEVVAARLSAAAGTLRNLPGRNSSFLDVAAARADPGALLDSMGCSPSVDAHRQLAECLLWLGLLEQQDAVMVWMRAEGSRWRAVCIHARVRRSNADRRVNEAYAKIARHINGQGKPAKPARVARKGAAT